MQSSALQFNYRFRIDFTLRYMAAMVGGASLALVSSSCLADDELPAAGAQRLVFVESLEQPDLVGVNRLIVSSDNEFLYAASWRGDNLSIFSRNSQGTLEHLKTLNNRMLKGAIKLEFNHDESWLAVICMRSSTVLLYARDADSGELQPQGFGRTEMVWPTSLSFAPDSKFLYVGDAGGNSVSQAQSAIVIFQVKDEGGLKYLNSFTHPELIGMRNVFISQDGRHAYAMCSSARCIFVLERDGETGDLKLLQQVKDGEGDIALLHGVHSAWFSPDGKRMYSVAGRFEGTSGVTVFSIDDEGRLTPLYSWAADKGFAGGNDIQVTQDERTIIVSGTTGNSLAVLDNNLEEKTLNLSRLIPGDAEILLQGPSGLTFDATQSILHVAVEMGSAITTFALKEAE